jgi:tetratricopeptide (TPR) repeat protein
MRGDICRIHCERKAALTHAPQRLADSAKVQRLLEEAVRHHDGVRLDEAKQLYQRILAADAAHAKSLHGLGLIARQTGDFEGAIRWIGQAISADPNEAAYHFSLGGVLQGQRRFDDAFAEFKEALALSPNRAETHNAIAAIMQLQGKLQEAKTHYERAVALQPAYAAAFCNLGVVLQNLGDPDGSVACQRKAIALRPDLAEAHNNLGLVLRQQGKLDEARTHYDRAVNLRPNYVEAHCNLAVLLRQQDRLEESLACLLKSLELRPNFAPAFDNLGNTLRDMGRLDESAASHQQALAIAPNYAKAHNNLGVTLRKQGKLSEARASHNRALELEPAVPDFRWNLSLIDLLEGKFEAGWKGYESRHERGVHRPRSFPKPQWYGEPLNGARILLHSEQGLGDSLQFLRYVPMVSAAGGTVILDVPASLRRLAAQLPGVHALTTNGQPLPAFDCHAPLMSLPLAFQTSLDSIPTQVPYFTVPEDALRAVEDLEWNDTKLRVGLVWSGNPICTEDRIRSVHLSHFQPFLGIDGCEFFSLQMGAAASQLEASELGAMQERITDLRFAIKDFADTAALMTHLDLVITADTSVAHLAGAQAKPTWTLIPFSPDWRWLLEREDSPWYPTMRLFRQPKFGDWQSVMDRVHSELAKQVELKQHAESFPDGKRPLSSGELRG